MLHVTIPLELTLLEEEAQKSDHYTYLNSVSLGRQKVHEILTLSFSSDKDSTL